MTDANIEKSNKLCPYENCKYVISGKTLDTYIKHAIDKHGAGRSA